MKNKGKIFKFVNSRLISFSERVRKDLCIQDDIVIDSSKFESGCKEVQEFDCRGLYISPGLIDIQINGSNGYDFSNIEHCITDSLDMTSKWCLKYGVTGFCPTVISSSAAYYEQMFKKLKDEPFPKDGANIFGIHLEGPFISKSHPGTHEKDAIVEFDPSNPKDTLTKIYGNNFEKVAYVTIAPEIAGGIQAVKELVKMGIRVSAGHTDANYDTYVDAFTNGATLITHIFNAMPQFQQREPGALGIIASNKLGNASPYFGLICDGVHMHRESVNILHKCNKEKLILVTDSTPFNGLADSECHIGNTPIVIKNQVAYTKADHKLAGSMATLNNCVFNYMKFTDCSLEQALKSATIIPAAFLGIENNYGSLDITKKASFILFDDDFNVHASFVDGKLKFLSNQSKIHDSFQTLI